MIAKLLSRAHPLAGQVLTCLVGGSILIAVAVYTSRVVDRSLQRAATESDAALMARDIQTSLDSVTILALQDRIAAPPSNDPNRASITIDRSVRADSAILRAVNRAEALHALMGSAATLQILAEAQTSSEMFDTYLADPTYENYSTTAIHLAALQELSQSEIPMLADAAQRDQSIARNAALTARWTTIVVIIATALGMGVATLMISRRLYKAAVDARAEEQRLLEATCVMQRRNDQFAALYQVGSEVSESLSMKYVVETTVREARKLVGADVVAVRRVVNGALLLAGTEQDADVDVAGLGVVPLGTGLVGRAAKRGKTIRIDSGAAAQMSPAEHVVGIESGIVVPLIVGARVVGTLGCWSRMANHFDADDERILEMMATQVATAIASADTHEQSERNAHSDALTSLPNRRQLNDDLHGALLEATMSGTPHAIAMVDIDNFKRFNDDYGHKVGDITLQKVAEVLKSSIRDQDRVYRFGGEEFLLIFADVDAENAMKLAERARAAVERTPLTGETLQPVGPITISVGVALFPDHSSNMEELIDIADRAMYASKQTGRNRVTLAGCEPNGLSEAA